LFLGDPFQQEEEDVPRPLPGFLSTGEVVSAVPNLQRRVPLDPIRVQAGHVPAESRPPIVGNQLHPLQTEVVQ
jgi:hypothetical protein